MDFRASGDSVEAAATKEWARTTGIAAERSTTARIYRSISRRTRRAWERGLFERRHGKSLSPRSVQRGNSPARLSLSSKHPTTTESQVTNRGGTSPLRKFRGRRGGGR